jgi:lipoprotein-anchoring transpeptidase ErfK/SrfK
MVAALGGMVCLCLLAAACTGAASTHQPTSAAFSDPPAVTPDPTPPGSVARVSIAPGDGSANVEPGAGIRVGVAGGTIVRVKVRTEGDPVTGDMDAGGTAWRSRWALDVDTAYTVSATAVDASGKTVTATSSFRTLAPAETFRTTIFEGYQKTYGVGMPIILTFDRDIQYKRAVERSLQVSSTHRVVGAWYWDGDRTLYFRPRNYWPANTNVGFIGHLNGVEGAPGVYGVHTLRQSFLVGRSLIAVASTVSHHVLIYKDRRLFGDWPISSGKPGDDTPKGTYVTIEKTNPEEMKGPGYDIMVPWSVRFTWSGDFLHDAFWSVGQQGFANVSHGCVNLSPEHAKIYYEMSVPGDPVTITGSPRGGTWGNGWTIWFLSWRDYLRGSALHQAVRVGPKGSSFVDPSTLPESNAKPPLEVSPPGNASPAS